MALEVRRIVTGHDSQGKAVVATDECLAGTGAAGRGGISRVVPARLLSVVWAGDATLGR